jgi:arylsulfatase A-like enzyme
MTIAQNVSPAAKDRTRHLILLLSIWSVVLSIVTRVYILAEAPLPPANRVAWLIGALAQDVAVLAAIGIICLLAPRNRLMQLAARFVFGIMAISITVLQVVRAEAVIFFGEAVRPEDLHRDVRMTVLLQSLSGAAAALLMTTALTLPFVLWMWKRSILARPGRFVRFAMLMVILTFAGVIGLLAERFIGEGLGRNPIIEAFMIEREGKVAPIEQYENKPPRGPITAIRDFVPPDLPRTYLDPQYPLAYLPGRTRSPIDVPPGVKPNIVIVLMESLRTSEMGCYGAFPANLTPNLDALARSGIRVDDMFSSGTYTASAEMAFWYGLPPVPREILITARPQLPLVGLPEILRSAGWNTMMWLHSGDLDFYRRDMFYLPRGFRIVDARAFPRNDPSTNWGYSDRSLARHSITALTRAREPFAAMVLTVSNHHMFQLPRDAGPRVRLPPHHSDAQHVRVDDLLQTVRYTDDAVGDFMREARTKEWFNHTIFIFTGDHGLAMPPFRRDITTSHQLFELLHRVPLIIYSPMIKHPAVLRGPATHTDLLPTLLTLAAVPRPRTGLGSDLFAIQKVEDRYVPLWGTHARMFSLVGTRLTYHSSYTSDVPFESQAPEESVVDTIHDPNGAENIMDMIPKEELEHFRHLRDVYLEVYPWLVINGRSGLPAKTAVR